MNFAFVLVVYLGSGGTLNDPEHLTQSQCERYAAPYRKAGHVAKCIRVDAPAWAASAS
jgi:hypothetical protein